MLHFSTKVSSLILLGVWFAQNSPKGETQSVKKSLTCVIFSQSMDVSPCDFFIYLNNEIAIGTNSSLQRDYMRHSTKLSLALVTVGVLVLSACGN